MSPTAQRKLYFTFAGGPVFHASKAEEAAVSDEPHSAK